MGGYKSQLTGKYERKFQFITFLTLNSLFTSENAPLLTVWVTFPTKKLSMTTGMYKVSIKSLAKHK